MPASVEIYDAEDERFDIRALWRLVAWGSGAAIAVAVAVLAGASKPGSQRLADALTVPPAAMRPNALPTPQLPARSADADGEMRRLSETVRTLTADRDRMLARIATLERTVDDATGAIGADRTPPRTSPPTPPSTSSASPASPATPSIGPSADSASPAQTRTAPAPPPPTPASAPAGTASSLPPGWPIAASLPLDLPTQSWGNVARWSDLGEDPEEAVATRPEFGIDIGGAASVDALRALWASAKNAHGALLERLRPIVGVREVRPGFVELRLIVGPVGDAAAAARLCASVATHGRTCRPAVFDGQRLASR